MRLPSAGGTSDGGHCCTCAVLGALFFCVLRGLLCGLDWVMTKIKLRGRDTPPIHRRYRWWRGMLKGAVAGTSPTGPWTDGRTGARTPDDDERHPWRIPLDRPCLLCYLVQKWFKPDMTSLQVGGGVFRTHKSISVICVAVALPPTLMRSRLLEELKGRSWLFSCSL